MSNKGADARSIPLWIQALVDPELLERTRQNQIKAHRALQKKLTQQKQTSADDPLKSTNDFFVKQHILSKNGKMIEDSFKSGDELKWIQTMLSLDNQDPDPTHDNSDSILRTLQIKDPDQIPVDQQALVATQDQKKLARREVNDEFIDFVIANLEKSNSKSVIVNLSNPINESHPLALVLLKGENGLWLHDPKFGGSIQFKSDDMDSFKKFLKEHIDVYHQGFNMASITQVFNKNELEARKEQTMSHDARVDAMAPGAMHKRTQETTIKADNKVEAKLEEDKDDKSEKKKSVTPTFKGG